MSSATERFLDAAREVLRELGADPDTLLDDVGYIGGDNATAAMNSEAIAHACVKILSADASFPRLGYQYLVYLKGVPVDDEIDDDVLASIFGNACFEFVSPKVSEYIDRVTMRYMPPPFTPAFIRFAEELKNHGVWVVSESPNNQHKRDEA